MSSTKAIKQLEKIKADYFFITSHQLRTPLSAVKWMLELLLKGRAGKLTAKQREYLLAAQEANERTIVLINDLLKIALLEKSKLALKAQRVEFNHLLREVLWELKPQQLARKITIKLEPKKTVKIFIKVDPLEFRQALINIVANAIKYSPAKSQILLIINKQNKKLLFSCQDQGPGIAQKDQPRIFSKFFRTPEAIKNNIPGSGLGLYIAKAIVKASGGKIWFVSQPEQGTTFYLCLPTIN